MSRPIGLVFTLLAVTAVAFAANDDLRAVAVTQLRTLAQPLFERGESTDPHFDAFYAGMVEELPPQARAERALELTINRHQGAAEYVMKTAQSWRRQIEPTPALTSLITTAMNAPRLEIRMAAYEVHLAQFDLDKTPEQVDRLLARLRDDPRGSGPWALWSMAVIGARGVDRERVFNELMMATRIDDEYVRRWAVDALAKFGGVEVIDPLLELAAHDPSALIQERAFCGLAQSGTLHIAERYHALPGLLAIVENPQSNKQTRDWSYQALREISGLYAVAEKTEAWRDALTASGLLQIR
ncbi:MAG: HEAT repeat domain-containing protein [Lysobacterales bacterium]